MNIEYITLLVIVLIPLTVFGIFYFHITAKSKERLALIEKGMDPNLARSPFLTQAAIIAGCFSIGLITGDYLPTKYGYGPLIGILFASAGLIFFNLTRKNDKRKSI